MDALKFYNKNDESLINKISWKNPPIDIISKIGIVITIMGLFTMEFFHILSNIGIIILTLSGCYFIITKKTSTKSVIHQRVFISFSILFLLFLISIFFTDPDNRSYAVSQFELKILYLAIPFSFAAIPAFEKKIYHHLFFFFFSLVIISSLPSTIFYFSNKEEMLYQYGRSGVLPTPVNHVRYSLMICYAIFLGAFLLVSKYSLKTNWKYLILITGTLYLIFFLHLLSVRSGLVSFYVLLLGTVIYLAYKKKYLATFVLSALIVILLSISFQLIETLKTKWYYTLYDLEQSSNKESSNNYSLQRRVLANEISWKIFIQNPLLGVGEGNIKAVIHSTYKTDHPYIEENNIIMTHNQYLRILAATGIIGFIIFMICFYLPLFTNKNYKLLPLLWIYIIVSISFFVEDTLHTQLGLIFSLFFISLSLHYLKTFADVNK
jgi:O-antigen ligase